MEIKIKRFDESLPIPQYEDGAAGFDFFCRIDMTIAPNEIKGVPANVALVVPKDHVLLVVPRSSTPTRTGLIMPHSIGVIDPFFCGDDNEIQLIFKNTTDKPVTIKKGDKLAQGLLIKCEKTIFKEVKKLKKLNVENFNYDRN